MSVTMCVPCHNHWAVTAKCLVSIFKSEIPYDYKVVVVDDASTDATQQLLTVVKKEGKPLKVITHSKNLGYIASMNDVLKTFDTEYILFMNNDVLLKKDCVAELIKNFEKHADVGILGGTQHDSNWKELSPLIFFLRGDKAIQRDHVVTANIPKELKSSDTVYCDCVHSPCALTSKRVVDKVGYWDEQFGFGNYEQEDYCLRIKEAHYQVAICPKAKFIHFVATSVSDNLPFWTNQLNKNRELFLKKWGEKLRLNLV